MMSSHFGEEFYEDDPEWATGEDVDNDNNDLSSLFKVGAQHVMLLLDCHKDMFIRRGDDTKSPMDLSLHIARQLIRETIKNTVTLKTGKRNGVGLFFFHTKLHKDEKIGNDDDDNESDSDSDDEYQQGNTVRNFIDLAPPQKEQAQKLQRCIDKEDFDLEETYGCFDMHPRPRVPPLSSALEECMRCFAKADCVKEARSKYDPVDSKVIWIFTNRSDPYPNASSLVQNVAKDAKEQGISIMLWPLVGRTDFDASIFYQELCSEPPCITLKSVEDMEDRLLDVRACWKRVRRLYHGPMFLADMRHEQNAPAIWVDWFRLVQDAKKPPVVKIDRQTNLEAITVSDYIDKTGSIFATIKTGNTDEGTDMSLPQPGMQHIRRFAQFGGEFIPLEEEEMREIRREANGGLADSNLVLLGFKSIHSIPWHHALEEVPYIIYPNLTSDNADMVQQNTDAFSALHAAMLRKKVLAIGEVLHRSIWQSRMVAIYPVQEVFYEENPTLQKRPAAFLVITLPFEDDFQDVEIDDAMKELVIQETRNEDLVMTEEVLKKEVGEGTVPCEIPSTVFNGKTELGEPITGNVASDQLVNAATRLMQKQILDGKELGEDFDDPDLEKFFNFIECVALEDLSYDENGEYDTMVSDGEILRVVEEEIGWFKAELPKEVNREKVLRKRKLVEDNSGLDWHELHRSNELQTLRVNELQIYCRAHGLKVGGRKSDLMDRVTEHLKKKNKSFGYSSM